MRGYGLIGRTNYRLASHVLGARPITVTPGPVQVQYKIPCFTVFDLLTTYNLQLDFDYNQQHNQKLHFVTNAAFVTQN